MIQNQNRQNEQTAKPLDMYTWRLNRMQAEKREETVNRQIMRRQFTH